MVSRRAYKRVKVNSLDIKELVTVAKTEKSAVLGLDVAKAEIVACLRWQSEDFERPWSVSNPCGIDELVKLLTQLISHGLELKVALESTGTYGDAGIPMSNQDQQWLQETSQRLLDAKTRAKACEIKLRKELEEAR